MSPRNSDTDDGNSNGMIGTDTSFEGSPFRVELLHSAPGGERWGGGGKGGRTRGEVQKDRETMASKSREKPAT